MEHGELTGAILDGRYRVLEPVAEGAMGVVYRAERVKLGRIVAIKVLHDLLPDELSGRKRFEIEALAMAKLEHPHCASVLDIGVHGARPFVVMDFVSGQSLKQLISGGPLPLARATEIVRQVLSGLAHAHEHGIVHRDVKPANIVLSHKTGLGDHVKILDFGLARLRDTGQNLTAGLAVGTPAYMAPEQIRGQKVDHRADLYACGVLLFELLTGKKPFHSETDDPIEVCKRHLSDPIPRLDSRRPGVEFGDLEAVVAKALAKRANKRFATAQDFAAAIDAAVGRSHRPGTPVPPSAPPTGPFARPATEPLRHAAPGETSDPPPVEVRSSDVMLEQPAEPEMGTAALISLDEGEAHGRAAVFATSTPGAPVAGSDRARRGGRAASPRAAAGEDPADVGPAGTFLGIAVPRTPRSARPTTGPASRAAGPADGAADDRNDPDGNDSSDAADAARADRDGRDGRAELAQDAKPAWRARPARPATPAPATRTGQPARAARAADAATARAKAAAGVRPLALRPRRWRGIAWFAAAVVAVVGAGFAVQLAREDDASAPAPAEPAAAEPAAAARRPDPGRDIVARANELVAQGNRDAALELVNKSRRQTPASAGLAYTAGRIYFAKLYWSDGLKAFRDAIRSDPSYRSDRELIRAVVRGFLTTPGYSDDLAGFLRNEIGAPAKLLLEEAARDQASAAMRNRAASELRRYRGE